MLNNSNINTLDTLMIKSVFDSIYNNGKDVLIDYPGICIDDVLNNDVLKQIPIVKTVLAVANVGLQLKEKYFIIKFYKFLLKLKKNDISSELMCKHRKILSNNKKRFNKEMQVLSLFINEHKFDGQSERLANIYTKLIEEKIDWELFVQLVDANNKILDADIKVLIDVRNKNNISNSKYYIVNKLVSLGLVYQSSNTYGSIEKPLEYFDVKNFDISILGKEFIDVLCYDII